MSLKFLACCSRGCTLALCSGWVFHMFFGRRLVHWKSDATSSTHGLLQYYVYIRFSFLWLLKLWLVWCFVVVCCHEDDFALSDVSWLSKENEMVSPVLSDDFALWSESWDVTRMFWFGISRECWCFLAVFFWFPCCISCCTGVILFSLSPLFQSPAYG